MRIGDIIHITLEKPLNCRVLNEIYRHFDEKSKNYCIHILTVIY